MSKMLERSFLYPMNPIFSMLLGFFSIIWGLWLLIPKPETIEQVYFFIGHPAFHYGSSAITILCGLFLLYCIYSDKTAIVLARPLMWIGFVYMAVGFTIAFSDWTNNSWLMYAFVALCAFFTSASYTVRNLDTFDTKLQ